MNALVLMGSPRLRGNTAELCKPLMEELRAQGVCDLKDVKYAVLENSGQLSVLPWPSAQPPAARDLGVSPEDGVSLPVILINDGRLIAQNLQRCGRDLKWLRAQLKRSRRTDLIRRVKQPGLGFLAS